MRAVIFDLDGTLVDSAPDLAAAANRMLAGLGRAALDLETITGFVGNGVEMLVRRALAASGPELGGAQFDAALGSFRAAYDAELVVRTRAYPGVEGLIAELAGRGIRLGVCTNKPEAPARAICQALGLSRHVAAVVGGDTMAEKKPDPAPLRHTMDLLGSAAGETLFVGDSETDWLTARAAGVRFAYFEGGYQRRPIPEFRPDFRVSSMDRVAGLV